MWCQEATWGPKEPHDAHDAGSWGAAGRLKCARTHNKTLQIHAVGGVCGCEYHCWQHMRCMISMRQALHALHILPICPALLWLLSYDCATLCSLANTLNVAHDLQETVPVGYNMNSLRRVPCSTLFLTAFLGF